MLKMTVRIASLMLALMLAVSMAGAGLYLGESPLPPEGGIPPY